MSVLPDRDIKSSQDLFELFLTNRLDDQEWLPGQELQHEPLESRPKGVKVAIRRKSQAQSTSPTSIGLFSLSAAPSDSSLMVQLVDHLEENNPPGMTIRNLGSFFPFIPSRLGHSRALDDAVQCICTAYSALLCSNGSAIGQDRREYYQALRSLRLACQDKDEVLSSNVLCAAVLLSWYEVSFAQHTTLTNLLNRYRYWPTTSTIRG
jgi:hypothetical protein